jgi:SAM-dependent methyltransferase
MTKESAHYARGFAVRERRFFFMSHECDFDYYEKMAHWSFDEFGIESNTLTRWDLYFILRNIASIDARILDLGTAGGEKIFTEFPDCAEILGTDYSPAMIETANATLAKTGKKNISFRVMDNLHMDVPSNYFDYVVARHTCIDPSQIYDCLKPGGLLLVRGVDKYDCWALKLLFGGGQCYNDPVPISIIDYENVLKAGFTNVELVPIYTRELFEDPDKFKAFIHTVPILEGVDKIDDALLDEYIENNQISGKTILRRMYYGLSARKPGPELI